MADHDSTPYGVIYCIEHRESGMRYIGQTVQKIEKRWAGHKRCGYCVHLHRAIIKYGEDAFDMYEIDSAQSKEDLDTLEDFYIKLFNTTDRNIGYNLRGGGSFGKHSDESKKKMSEKVRFAYENTDLRDRLRKSSWIGRPLTEYQKKCLIAANLGKRHTKETLDKLSERRKQLWLDDTARQNMRNASVEARKSEEYKTKVSEITKKQWADPEYRIKLLEARSKTQEAGNAARKAAWNDPVKKAARLAKLAATRERKRIEAQTN